MFAFSATLKPSYKACCLSIVLHSMALFFLLIILENYLLFFGLLICMVSAYYSIQVLTLNRKDSIKAIRYSLGGDLKICMSNDEYQTAMLLNHSYSSTWFIVLVLQVSHCKIYQVIVDDMVDQDVFRKLKVYLSHHA